MSIDYIQNIVIRLREIFPDEIEQLDISKYKNWIELNQQRWKDKIEPIHFDKIFYGLAKETKKFIFYKKKILIFSTYPDNYEYISDFSNLRNA